MPTKVKKAEKKLVLSAVTDLKLAADGKSYAIVDEETAKIAVEKAGKTADRIAEIKAGELNELEADLGLIRAGLRDYQVDNKLAEVISGEYKSDLVERTGNFWVLTENDIPEEFEEDEDIVPLMDILKKKIRDPKKRIKLINRITKRVLIPGAIDDVVKEGLLKAEHLVPAFVEFVQTSYVQIKENK